MKKYIAKYYFFGKNITSGKLAVCNNYAAEKNLIKKFRTKSCRKFYPSQITNLYFIIINLYL